MPNLHRKCNPQFATLEKISLTKFYSINKVSYLCPQREASFHPVLFIAWQKLPKLPMRILRCDMSPLMRISLFNV